jgi:hypothetical protein
MVVVATDLAQAQCQSFVPMPGLDLRGPAGTTAAGGRPQREATAQPLQRRPHKL